MNNVNQTPDNNCKAKERFLQKDKEKAGALINFDKILVMNQRPEWISTYFPTLTDYTILVTYLILIFLFAYNHQRRKQQTNPAYSLFTRAIYIKIAGAFAFGLIYLLYYHGRGDTTGYFAGGKTLVNLLLENPKVYFRILFGDMSREAFSHFSRSTGYPTFTHDYESFAINRITSIFVFFGFKNYFTASMLFASFFFVGSWKLYLLVTELYPKYYKGLAFAVLFFPSVLFWSSGISKDTVAMAMTAWFTYGFYQVFVKRQKIFKNIGTLVISAIVIVLVKPYIIVALMPGAFIWLGWNQMSKIANPTLRILIKPLALIFFLGIGLGLLNLFSRFLGNYGSIENIIAKAIEMYEDHTRAAQYGENFYELGAFDGTVGNFFSKAPIAIFTGLFRPLPWEARNILMLISGIENLSFLLFVLYIFWRTGVVKTLKIVFEEPMVVFSLSFAVIFAFAVGISSGNFGALVRLKTPLLPFLITGLYILFFKSQELKKGKEANENKNFVIRK